MLPIRMIAKINFSVSPELIQKCSCLISCLQMSSRQLFLILSETLYDFRFQKRIHLHLFKVQLSPINRNKKPRFLNFNPGSFPYPFTFDLLSLLFEQKNENDFVVVILGLSVQRLPRVICW